MPTMTIDEKRKIEEEIKARLLPRIVRAFGSEPQADADDDDDVDDDDDLSIDPWDDDE